VTRRILVVDDDRGMVATLRDILELHGWETVPAYDGAEAVAVALEQEIDVVLMDVKMPRVDGVAALQAIRRKRPRTRVILMTAYAAQALLEQAEQEGVVRILRKPVDLPELFSLLEAAAQELRAVLVVDDDPAFLQTLCDVLTERGLVPVKAASLNEALAELEAAGPRAVLLDLKLDHLDPRSSLLAIREMSPSVLLVLYSGHPAELTATVEASPDGMVDAAFTKPLPIDELMELLHGVAEH
jgi:DNA-binding NtrC family response regulator